MDTKYFIANWKSHKSTQEAREFMWAFARLLPQLDLSDKKIIICPPYPSLTVCTEFVRANDLPIALGTQNISAFPAGAYTGEINGEQIKEFATYVVIGHSERKRYFHETPEDIRQKVDQAKVSGLIPILCVQNEDDTVVDGVGIIAFEPPSAIGSGKPDSPEDIEKVFGALHEKYPSSQLLYGGSINEENIKNFLAVKHLKGFLIGGASLDPQQFYQLMSVC